MRDTIGYDYLLRITRPGTGQGTYNEDTGEYTPAALQVIYDGAADVQDRGEALPRNSTGQPVKVADATVFLPESKSDVILDVEPGDKAIVTYPDRSRTAEGEVAFANEMDASILVTYRA
jgi:hypothetical protein